MTNFNPDDWSRTVVEVRRNAATTVLMFRQSINQSNDIIRAGNDKIGYFNS